MKRKKYGFSFIELILILVFFFLILAALMPMITRRHLAPPTRVSHGTYACYWQKEEDDSYSLRETLVKGRKTIIDNQVVNEDVGCRFEAPRKAKYFYVQIIGGGGGGRDINWYDEVNPANIDKYRVYGSKKMSKDDEGYFVKTPEHKVFTDTMELDWSQYKELLEPGLLSSTHFLYLHAKSGDGGVCSGNPKYPESSTCDIGYEPDLAYCAAEINNSAGCGFALMDCPECSELKIGNKTRYTFICKDENGDGHCDDDTECTGKMNVRCDSDEDFLSFSSYFNTDRVVCNNDLNGKGIEAWARMGTGSKADIFVAGLITGDFKFAFERHDTNHSNCIYRDTVPLTSTDWNAYKVKNNKPTIFEPLAYQYNGPKEYPEHMQNGQGYWFKGRIASNLVPLYVCGGQGAERGVYLGNNPRAHSDFRATANEFCSPAYGNPGETNSSGTPVYNNGLRYDQWDSNWTFLTGSGEGDFKKSKTWSNTSPYEHDYLDLRIINFDLAQHQELPYGVGGRAGVIKTLILKSIPDGVYIMPGKGGKGGLEPTDGEKSLFGSDEPGSPLSEKIAEGGAAGKEIYSIDAEIGPSIHWPTPGTINNSNIQKTNINNSNRVTSTENQDSRFGGTISYASFVKFVISYNNKLLKERMVNFGRGGNGAATATFATCGYEYHAISLYDKSKSPKVIKSIAQPGQPVVDAGTFSSGCNGYSWNPVAAPEGEDADYNPSKPSVTDGYHWGYYANGPSMEDNALRKVQDAQDGQTGAIVISW